MTPEQEETLKDFAQNEEFGELHHGDCVGADATAHALVREHRPDVKIVVHPPKAEFLRAFCSGDREYPPKKYLERDDFITEIADVIVGTPHPDSMKRRDGGTWYTLRCGRRRGKRVFVIEPDGNMRVF